jgi:hypothetical protein
VTGLPETPLETAERAGRDVPHRLELVEAGLRRRTVVGGEDHERLSVLDERVGRMVERGANAKEVVEAESRGAVLDRLAEIDVLAVGFSWIRTP